MPIQSGDVKLLKSAVMADVPEGGGAPTGTTIADGVSNAIFPDISELDRAGGRVNLRKSFVSVQTDDTDTYFGANVIVAEPPQDPRVSVTLFSTEKTFDTREQAQVRIEAYLNKGPEWAGYLFENHIAGQRVIQLFQRTTDTVPNVGQTLVLIENEGLGTQKEQYIRATSVSVVERTFTYDGDKDYKASIVTVDISDALRYDFTGSPASRTFTRAANSTKTRDTVSIELSFADGSIGTVHYFANGCKAFPKERLEVFAAGRVLQLDNFSKLTGFAWPGFTKMNLWKQDKGQKACASAFVQAVASGGASPIPFEELLEVARVTIDAADQCEGGR